MVEGTFSDIAARLFIWYEPAHDKTYNKTCVTSKNSDQPVRPPSMPRVLIYPVWIVNSREITGLIISTKTTLSSTTNLSGV